WLVVTVSAHRWLGSRVDEFAGHTTRYSRKALRDELTAMGLRIRIFTHAFSWLVAPTWWKRRGVRHHRAELGLDQASPIVDRLGLVMTLVERQLLGRVVLPFGTSVIAVAQKT